MTEYTPEITVTDRDFRTAVKHGMELWWSGTTPKKRLDQRGGRDGFTRYVNARVEGKLAEVAFSRFLELDFGIRSQVDWRIYGDYETTDNGDLQYLLGDDGEEYEMAVELDVKKTKPWNQWLAIRTEIFDQHPDDAPYVLTKFALTDDMDVDRWEDTGSWEDVTSKVRFNERVADYTDDHFPIEVEIVGTAYPDEFTDDFEQGDRLYDPDSGDTLGGPLRRPNAGIHVSDLVATKERWNRVVDEITDDYPIDYDEL